MSVSPGRRPVTGRLGWPGRSRVGGDRAGQPTAEPVFGSGKNVRSSTPSESPRKNSFVETLALTPPLSPGPGQAAYEHCEQT